MSIQRVQVLSIGNEYVRPSLFTQILYWLFIDTEVILATIISSFKLSPAENAKDIVWNTAAVKYPTVGRENIQPALPLLVERIKAWI